MTQGKHPHSKREVQEDRKRRIKASLELRRANIKPCSSMSSIQGTWWWDVSFSGAVWHSLPHNLARFLGWLCFWLTHFLSRILCSGITDFLRSLLACLVSFPELYAVPSKGIISWHLPSKSGQKCHWSRNSCILHAGKTSIIQMMPRSVGRGKL